MFYFLFISQHIVELLRQQQFLEIFLEGTRSRSGKTSCARAGLLSVVVDTLSTNTIPDILIIPVGISYDRIIEGHYNGEQLVRRPPAQKLSSLLQSFAFAWILLELIKNCFCTLKFYSTVGSRQGGLPSPTASWAVVLTGGGFLALGGSDMTRFISTGPGHGMGKWKNTWC